VDISNATERRHSSEIAANAQKHKQRNLEKPATDVQDKPATNGQIKEDTVEISEEGKILSMREAPFKIGTSLDISRADISRALCDDEYKASHSNFLFRFGNTLVSANDLKDSDDATNLIWQALGMVHASPSERLLNVSYNDTCGYTTFKDLELTANSREAGKKLAEYIAQNYFNDPDKAKAFMDNINEIAYKNEMRDEDTLNFWAENMKKMEDISAKDRAQLQAQYPPNNVAAPSQPKPDLSEPTSSYDDAFQSIVEKGESVHDWFANFIGKAAKSVQNLSIQDLLAKYSVKVA
jgi:hypothetical protein